MRLRKTLNDKKYVFHGSKDGSIVKLKPRQPKNFNHKTKKMENDGDPAVVATGNLDIAVFRALTAQLPGRSRFGLSDGVPYFGLSDKALLSFKDAVGFVYILDKKNFTKYNNMEWRSSEIVTPVEILKVTSKDFQYPVENIPEIKDI